MEILNRVDIKNLIIGCFMGFAFCLFQITPALNNSHYNQGFDKGIEHTIEQVEAGNVEGICEEKPFFMFKGGKNAHSL